MYLSVKEIAIKWQVSERTVRNHCANGKISGAFLTGKTWNIPKDALLPTRKNAKSATVPTRLLDILQAELQHKISGGIYHKIQIDLTYNSSHIEGSQLSHEETRYIFETHTIGTLDKPINVDDIIETANHFNCIDKIIANANSPLSEKLIKNLHFTLKNGSSDSRKPWFNVGEYKSLPNEVGGTATTAPQDVKQELSALIKAYNSKSNVTFEDILDFHHKFETIHPFQDGNGRVGRLIMFKECLKHNFVPFIIDDNHKYFYYRGLKEWETAKGYLLDTCLSCQDIFKTYLDYFKIKY